ncbi:DNA internalization-related competence protein ComEC/Rec2 [Teredinibacter turnerae]|uniref:DNA internalization-related competence protein ComEC/Rec2 n=1 Tax=Teredinibacter turnerae TaxID=2426 RepID=UPI001E2B9ED5|nr:DNA internalization-related competence protein ComEC/Rec2 [Teredinibacter turnerae]
MILPSARMAILQSPTMLLFSIAAGLLTPALLQVHLYTLERVVQAGSIAALLMFCCWWVLRSQWRILLLLIGIYLAALSVQGALLITRIDEQIPTGLEGQTLAIRFVVESLPVVKARGDNRFVTQFYGRVTQLGSGEQKGRLLGKRLRLSWYATGQPVNLSLGENWQAKVRLRRPRGSVNPGGFDYQAWLLSRKISATGYVYSQAGVVQLEQRHEWPGKWGVQRARQTLARALFDNWASPQIGLLRALLIGDKSAITQDQWDVLRATGTVHLMAISGLHIGLMATIGFAIGAGFARVLAVYRPAGVTWLAPVFANAFAFFYAALAGFEIPTQRACIMVLCFSLIAWRGRQVNFWLIYSFALIGVLAIDPFAPVSGGFWLSFAAVAVLGLGLLGRAPRDGAVFSLVKAQALLLVGMSIPLTLIGLPVPVLGAVANLVAVPVVSFVVVPALMLAGLMSITGFSGGDTLLNLALQAMQILWSILSWLHATASRVNELPVTPFQGGGMRVGIGVVALIFILAPRGSHLRLPGGALLLLFLFHRPPPLPLLRVTHLDVQQGLAVIIEAGDYTLVYDTGARYSPEFDMGDRVVAPYLAYVGRQQVDRVVISHRDNDHAGGFAGLSGAVSVASVLAGEPDQLPRTKHTPFPCEQGQHWQANRVEFEVVWPPSHFTDAKPNNHSCVLVVRYGSTVILIAGDIEQSVEADLLTAGILPSKISLLTVPHHGSKTSSSVQFVSQLDPEFAVISAGYNNRYGHPHKDISRRYSQQGARIFRTDLDGGISFSLQADGVYHIEGERHRRPRPWFD